jgi:hypothetical protein
VGGASINLRLQRGEGLLWDLAWNSILCNVSVGSGCCVEVRGCHRIGKRQITTPVDFFGALKEFALASIKKHGHLGNILKYVILRHDIICIHFLLLQQHGPKCNYLQLAQLPLAVCKFVTTSKTDFLRKQKESNLVRGP